MHHTFPPLTVRKVVGGGFDGRLIGLHVRSLLARYSYSHTQIVHVRTWVCTLTCPSLPYVLSRNPFDAVRPCRCMHVGPSADASSGPPRHLQNPPTRRWWPRPVNEKLGLKKNRKRSKFQNWSLKFIMNMNENTIKIQNNHLRFFFLCKILAGAEGARQDERERERGGRGRGRGRVRTFVTVSTAFRKGARALSCGAL